MRIISKFRDYYDGVLPFSDYPVWERLEYQNTLSEQYYQLRSYEKSVLTNQQRELCEEMFKNLPHIRTCFTGPSSVNYSQKILGFCGKLYIINELKDSLPMIHKCFIDPEKFKNESIKLFNLKPKNMNISTEVSRGWWHMEREFHNSNEFLNHYNSKNDILELFITLKTPIFIIKSGSITSNISMREEKLTSIFNIQFVAQEIEMFLSNQLAYQNKPDCIMTDELRRDAHGMDEWSFKKKSKNKQ